MGHLPDGAHTHGGSSGGLGLALAIGAGAVIAAAVLPAVIAIVHALLIIVAVVAGLAVAAGAAVIIWRVRRPAPVPPWQPGTLHATPQPPAVDRPHHVHLHLHGVSPEDAAAILRQAGEVYGPASMHPAIGDDG